MRILAADIGGTNIRFGLFAVRGGGELECERRGRVQTASIHSGFELLQELTRQNVLFPGGIDAMVLAVAGPVQGRTYCRLTNADWALDLNDLRTGIPDKSVVINDFVAQALGCLTTRVRATMRTVQPGSCVPEGVLAAIGAGTGLGMCTLVPETGASRRYVPVASEGGHSPVPFLTRREFDLQEFITSQTGYSHAFGDTVVSGRGLAYVHQFLTGKKLDPAEAAAQAGPDSETTLWFARLYGRVCRIFSLHVLPRAGLFLCGGIGAKNPHFVMHPEFLREFTDCPAYGELLRSIPVHLVTDPEAGLFGAAEHARITLGQGGSGGADGNVV